ncbi:unnamed protein product [Clonostachys solani]|uniref:chitinase n=1 Tax=Clonostachys solani TaxID=160281 RepID=A0A9N9YUR1_9HYPO|nr:unnamed protein product [Clonostachys solani]
MDRTIAGMVAQQLTVVSSCLRTSCSEFGFCGTASDYCNARCQSNCEEHPDPPPASGSGGGDVLKRVIGYYKGWNAVSKCHQTLPVDLPLSALTHINFAFAFVEPGTYAIVPMDGTIATSLFTDTTNLKKLNPGLKVFISVGGWTFSDNGTVTQPLLGEISADATKRAKFSSQIVHFLSTYGFDGLDLDWEYPGAPDRGGKDEDTANMVLLFASIRSAFDKAKKGYELTFTIPASYWYLRWFDMPGLMKYADWTNLMSYDIHGIWDRENEIGNVVQPHTNLTEIKRATELLWRVGVPPDKIALGFGFYGRSFTLKDPNCSKPGCRFSGGSHPGACTATSGYLAPYEIQDILNKKPSIEVHHDEEAAVKYFSWDTNQWISYDDSTTFKQKVDWANKIGLSGSLIWAADLDDYEWSAHEGLFGKKIKPNNEIDNVAHRDYALSQSSSLVTSELRNDCFLFKQCVDRDIVKCGAGYSMVGYDKSGCGSVGSKPICEVTLYDSKTGGGFENESGESSCTRGHKVFCCQAHNFTDLTKDCAWTKWEVTLATDTTGDSVRSGCNWGRRKALCCTPNLDAIAPTPCDNKNCSGDESSCAKDSYADDFSDEDQCDPTDCFLDSVDSASGDVHIQGDKKRSFTRDFYDFNTLLFLARVVMEPRRYTGPTVLHAPTRSTPASTNVFRLSGTTCFSTTIEVVDRWSLTNQELEDGYDTEHNPDLQYVASLIWTAGTGILPDGSRAQTSPIDPRDLANLWNNQLLNPADTRTGSSRGIRTPNGYLMDQFGSQGNRAPLLILERGVNQIKGAIFTEDTSPRSITTMTNLLETAIGGTGHEELLQPIREAIAVFRYINHPDARPRIQANRRALLETSRSISTSVLGLGRLHALHLEHDANWYRTRTRRARTWVADQLVRIAAAFTAEENAGRTPTNLQVIRAALNSLFDDLQYMEPPPDDPNVP